MEKEGICLDRGGEKKGKFFLYLCDIFLNIELMNVRFGSDLMVFLIWDFILKLEECNFKRLEGFIGSYLVGEIYNWIIF